MSGVDIIQFARSVVCGVSNDHGIVDLLYFAMVRYSIRN